MLFAARIVETVVLALAAAVTAVPASAQRADPPGVPSTAGQLLVAAPELQDPNFVQTVVYMVRHSPDGALGFVVNRALGEVPAGEIGKAFDIAPEQLPAAAVRVHAGGPVAPRLGFVLHSRDYAADGTLAVDADVALTAQGDIDGAMFTDQGPRRRLVLLGHAGWAPGQLDAEIEARAWLIVPAEEAIVFDDELASKWERALALYEVRL